MSNKKIVQLVEPLLVGGQEIKEVSIRRSTVGDEEDAMQMAVRNKRSDNPVSVELYLMSKLAKLPYDVIRSMHGQDYQKLRNALNEINGIADEPENPMNGTPESV